MRYAHILNIVKSHGKKVVNKHNYIMNTILYGKIAVPHAKIITNVFHSLCIRALYDLESLCNHKFTMLLNNTVCCARNLTRPSMDLFWIRSSRRTTVRTCALLNVFMYIIMYVKCACHLCIHCIYLLSLSVHAIMYIQLSIHLRWVCAWSDFVNFK